MNQHYPRVTGQSLTLLVPLTLIFVPHLALTFLAFWKRRDFRSKGLEGVPMREESWKLGHIDRGNY